MLNSQNFLAAVNQLCDEKKINKDKVLEAIKEALKAAYRKDFGTRDQNIEIILNPESGQATVLLVKTIVKEIENRDAELTLAEGRKIKKDIKEGDKIKIDVTPIDYGRIASQSAKQVIIQKVQEAEREAVYEEYKDREDELLNALVHRVEGRFVYLELDRTTVVLEPRDQIPRERYQQGQRVKIYLEKVELTPRGPKLHISRTHPRLIFRLLELEIPEVRNETVIVKAVARDPGVRCKLVVDSTDESVDPVGACVGQKGSRIQNITDEISGERIDVIQYTDDFDALLKETLSPAKIDKIIKHEDEKRAEVYVAEDQRALAIGKSGQNVRLASEIMGWEIDILNTVDLGADTEDGESEEAEPETVENESEAKEEKQEKAEDSKQATKAEKVEKGEETEKAEKPVKDSKKAKEEKPAKEKKSKKEDKEKAEDSKEPAKEAEKTEEKPAEKKEDTKES